MRVPLPKLSGSNVVLWIAGAVSLMLVGVLIAGYDLWYQATYYVSSDYGQIAGAVTEVVTPGAARVSDLHVEVGAKVELGERLATLHVPGPAPAERPLLAPRAGTIVGIYAREGQLAFADQPVLALAQPSDLWVIANVGESELGAVQVGQPAEIQLIVLDRRLAGRVVEILPAAERASWGATAQQTVPVRIALEGSIADLYPGMAVYVKIRVH